MIYFNLKERLPGLLGGLQIVLDNVRHNSALRAAHVQSLLVSDPATHVPADLQQFMLDALALVVQVLEISDDVRFRE